MLCLSLMLQMIGNISTLLHCLHCVLCVCVCVCVCARARRGIDVVRNRIKMFAHQKVTLPPGRHKVIILDEADR